jgi:DNA-binding beta-propeller fold protein YncE
MSKGKYALPLCLAGIGSPPENVCKEPQEVFAMPLSLHAVSCAGASFLNPQRVCFLLVSTLIVLGGCGDRSKPTAAGDVVPPAAVTDLSIAAVAESSVTLAWTAPGDDGLDGTASAYEIRYGETPVTEESWDDAVAVTEPAHPAVAGSQETYAVKGLTLATEYFFALKAADEVPNWSLASNAVSVITHDSAPQFVMQWGSKGDGDGEFERPAGVATDLQGNVYVVELSNHRVQKFTSEGRFITKWGSEGTRSGQFLFPSAIAVSGDGSVYVVDLSPDRVQKFTSDGQFLRSWGTQGSGEGQFEIPIEVAVDDEGNVYVADHYNDRIQKFTSQGKFITKWGTEGEAPGQFDNPLTVAVDPHGNVIVADEFNRRVQKFTGEGVFLALWGSRGQGDGQFLFPAGADVDNEGNVYVADHSKHCIQKFTNDGAFLCKWGSHGSLEGQFFIPDDIAVDRQGNIYVADLGNHRIQKFAYADR